jgi:hypothetical protein
VRVFFQAVSDGFALARRLRAPRNGLGKNVKEGPQAVAECSADCLAAARRIGAERGKGAASRGVVEMRRREVVREQRRVGALGRSGGNALPLGGGARQRAGLPVQRDPSCRRSSDQASGCLATRLQGGFEDAIARFLPPEPNIRTLKRGGGEKT